MDRYELHAGDRFRLTSEDLLGNHEHASVSYSELPDEVRPGQSIILADGTVELEVESTGSTRRSFAESFSVELLPVTKASTW